VKLTALTTLKPDLRTYQSNDLLVDSTLLGLEIELEEVRLPNPHIDFNEELSRWVVKNDGSLRGEHALEFIFNGPMAGTDVILALEEFNAFLVNNEIKPLCSERTSVHVHVDVRDATLSQLISLILYYAIFEKALFRFANKQFDRYDNIFCIPLKEVISPFAFVRSLIKMEEIYKIYENANRKVGVNDIPYQLYDDYSRFINNNKRYCGINLVAIGQFGSLEFRMHEGTYDKSRLLNWINVLLSLKKYAFASTVAVEDIPKIFSIKGFKAILKEIFGIYADMLWYPDCEEDALDGLRHAFLSFLDSDQLSSDVEALLEATGSDRGEILNKIIERQKVIKSKLVRKTKRAI
jgi:hypothetical protein